MIEITRGEGGLSSYQILSYIVIWLRRQQIFVEHQVHVGVNLRKSLL